jgi:hypothetical protein
MAMPGKIEEKTKRVVPSETLKTAFVTRWIKNHRQVAGGTWVQKKAPKRVTKAVQKVAAKFYPAWVSDPWIRYLFPRHERMQPKAGARIPLALALDWQVDHQTMQSWTDDATTERSRIAHPDMQFFVNKSAKKSISRTFAECLLCYARRRWGLETGDERAHDALVAVLEHAHRDARKSEHRNQTDRRKRLGKKFSTKSQSEYWRWLLGFLHGTDKYKRPKERALAAVTVDFQDEIEES